mmetsp:Transcript_23456/g.73570  ORF Transcript_23456/g.73570 Transcript_23456/m.73570 type:complete len:97 (-) Transcript_23456:32-322(-)
MHSGGVSGIGGKVGLSTVDPNYLALVGQRGKPGRGFPSGRAMRGRKIYHMRAERAPKSRGLPLSRLYGHVPRAWSLARVHGGITRSEKARGGQRAL